MNFLRSPQSNFVDQREFSRVEDEVKAVSYQPAGNIIANQTQTHAVRFSASRVFHQPNPITMPSQPQMFPMHGSGYVQIAPRSQNQMMTFPIHSRETPRTMRTQSANYKSEIECGIIRNGTRVYKIKNEFFGDMEVEAFVAKTDSNRRILHRPSDLARKLGIPPTRIGMYLHRKKQTIPGVFQSTGFNFKQGGVKGLKLGSYFISEAVCKRIERSYRKRGPQDSANISDDFSGDDQDIIEDEEPRDLYADPMAHARTSGTNSFQQGAFPIIVMNPGAFSGNVSAAYQYVNSDMPGPGPGLVYYVHQGSPQVSHPSQFSSFPNVNPSGAAYGQIYLAQGPQQQQGVATVIQVVQVDPSGQTRAYSTIS